MNRELQVSSMLHIGHDSTQQILEKIDSGQHAFIGSSPEQNEIWMEGFATRQPRAQLEVAQDRFELCIWIGDHDRFVTETAGVDGSGFHQHGA